MTNIQFCELNDTVGEQEWTLEIFEVQTLKGQIFLSLTSQTAFLQVGAT